MKIKKFFLTIIFKIRAKQCGATLNEYLLIRKMDRGETLTEAEDKALDDYEDRVFNQAS